jgi:hypothetical protein
VRILALGEPFLTVPSDDFVPGPDDVDEMLTDIRVSRGERRQIPTFSEAYLYPRVGKGDARFILAVVEEYAKLIDVLGTERVRELLRDAP